MKCKPMFTASSTELFARWSAQVFRQAGVTPSGPGALVVGGGNGCVKRLSEQTFDGDNMYMSENNQEFLSPSQQNYSGQGGGNGNGGGGGDEDYEIPPITPPNHPEPPLLHLMDPESSYLCHSIPHNGLINPYSYPELPALMMSNMLAQDGHLLSSQMPSVSPALQPYIDSTVSRHSCAPNTKPVAN
ncbi:TOX high mobility group box family member 2-like [Garra rufa]|uniref:TOX high mobility group box family member 2-like n=1 Tax=Garra rufa TaxID=137080 RepID=UPI003CCEC40A